MIIISHSSLLATSSLSSFPPSPTLRPHLFHWFKYLDNFHKLTAFLLCFHCAYPLALGVLESSGITSITVSAWLLFQEHKYLHNTHAEVLKNVTFCDTNSLFPTLSRIQEPLGQEMSWIWSWYVADHTDTGMGRLTPCVFSVPICCWSWGPWGSVASEVSPKIL